MTVEFFIDSNVFLYAYMNQSAMNQSADKKSKAEALIAEAGTTVSVQVISEVCCNLKRKQEFSEPELVRIIEAFYRRLNVVGHNRDLFVLASGLRSSYGFSYWDSQIVASAVISGAKTLYSEDMQHGMKIGELRIVNPFWQGGDLK